MRCLRNRRRATSPRGRKWRWTPNDVAAAQRDGFRGGVLQSRWLATGGAGSYRKWRSPSRIRRSTRNRTARGSGVHSNRSHPHRNRKWCFLSRPAGSNWNPRTGKQADFVLIKGDPSKNIDEIENVETVFKAGIGYDSKKLIDSVRGQVGIR